jgi:hypothetical protein
MTATSIIERCTQADDRSIGICTGVCRAAACMVFANPQVPALPLNGRDRIIAAITAAIQSIQVLV